MEQSQVLSTLEIIVSKVVDRMLFINRNDWSETAFC